MFEAAKHRYKARKTAVTGMSRSFVGRPPTAAMFEAYGGYRVLVFNLCVQCHVTYSLDVL